MSYITNKKENDKKWFEELINISELESLEMFENRINEFIWDSVPKEGEFWTADSLKAKVFREGEESGKLKKFYGNTIVFPLDEKAISYVEEIQNELNKTCSSFLAEPLAASTFHITLHDLVNHQELEKISDLVKVKGFVALSLLEQLKKLEIPKIRMESTCVFNMASTSVVMGMKPVDEESCKNLMMLHKLFQEVVKLDYKLTPHVTLAYYKPGIYQAEELRSLRELIEKAKKKEKLIVELDVKQLAYQEFDSMNHYVTKEFNHN